MATPGLPPGPGPSKTLNMVKWMGKPAQLLESSRARYGDMWTLRLMGRTVFVFVSDPDLIEDFFTADPYVLRAGAAHQRIGTALLGKGSLLLLDEPEHMEIKQLLSPPFKSDHVQRYREGIARVAEHQSRERHGHDFGQFVPPADDLPHQLRDGQVAPQRQ